MGGWVYMLRCSDDSYYVGSTSHRYVETRVSEHNEGRYEGYTSIRRPITLVWADWFDDLRDAHAKERQLKGWSRSKQQALISKNYLALQLLSKRPPHKSDRPDARRSRAERISLAFKPLGDARQTSDHRHPEVRSVPSPELVERAWDTSLEG